MKRLILVGALCAMASVAAAQQAQLPVPVPPALLGAIYAHLQIGGTYAAGQELAREIQDLASAPQRDAAREAEIRKKIEDETKAKEPVK